MIQGVKMPKLPYKQIRERIRENIKEVKNIKKKTWKVDIKKIGLKHSNDHDFLYAMHENKEKAIEKMINHLKKYPEDFKLK